MIKRAHFNGENCVTPELMQLRVGSQLRANGER
jgi:hypothetical protein